MYHQLECRLIRDAPEICGAAPRFALRALSRVLEERKSESPTVGYFFEHRRTFEDLLSHAEDFSPQRVERHKVLAECLSERLLGWGYEVSPELLVEIALKLAINAHSVRDWQHVINSFSLGSAVYLGASKSDHSCEIKTDYMQIFIGNRIVFRALEDFSVSDSLELTTFYISPKHGYIERQRLLRKYYFFDCECKRCVIESRDPGELTRFIFDGLVCKPMYNSKLDKKLRLCEERFASYSNSNLFKNHLLTKMYLTSKRESLERSYFLATSALEGCKLYSDRLTMLFSLCLDFAHFGANQPSHEYYDEFRKYVKRATEFFSVALGDDSRLTKKLRSLGNTETEAVTTN